MAIARAAWRSATGAAAASTLPALRLAPCIISTPGEVDTCLAAVRELA